jgi:hypothetical protein
MRKELYIELFEKKYKGAKSLEEIISISEHELKFQTQKLTGEERRKRRKVKNAKTD